MSNKSNNNGHKRIGRIGDWSGDGPSSTGSAAPQPRTSGIATFSSLRSTERQAQAPHSDDDEGVKGTKKEGESWFAGGERSGISVQNPGHSGLGPQPQLVQDIFRRAAQGSPSAGQSTPEPSLFRGGGHTLGGDGIDSEYIPGVEAAQRNITFWRNGFSVEGGGFYSHRDPASEHLLQQISTGRAPVEVLNVSPDQPVEVCVRHRLDEDYISEPGTHAGFSGMGNRLGSPTPVFRAVEPRAQGIPGSFPSQALTQGTGRGAEPERISMHFEVDQTMPTTTVRVRQADGSWSSYTMNHTHTVGDLRNLINAANPGSPARAYEIGTGHPVQVFVDEGQTIKDAGLINSVVVQRWV